MDSLLLRDEHEASSRLVADVRADLGSRPCEGAEELAFAMELASAHLPTAEEVDRAFRRVLGATVTSSQEH